MDHGEVPAPAVSRVTSVAMTRLALHLPASEDPNPASIVAPVGISQRNPAWRDCTLRACVAGDVCLPQCGWPGKGLAEGRAADREQGQSASS